MSDELTQARELVGVPKRIDGCMVTHAWPCRCQQAALDALCAHVARIAELRGRRDMVASLLLHAPDRLWLRVAMEQAERALAEAEGA